MTTSPKKIKVNLLPCEIIEEEILIRLTLKSLIRFKCVSKNWNALISDDNFCRRYRSQQQKSKCTGFICGNITDLYDGDEIYDFCVANKFLYTNYVNKKEELEFFIYLNTFGKVIAASKSLLLVGPNLETLYVYDIVSKKHVKLPQNSLEAGPKVPLGFNCEENSTKNPLCYTVVCVENRTLRSRYNVEIYSSETGTMQKSIMKSNSYFHVWSHHIAKAIRGVFHWYDYFSRCIFAYDSEDPMGRVVFIELPKFDNYLIMLRQTEGRKDGSLQFISMDDDKVLKVWIMSSKNGRIGYMDEDKVGASRWGLVFSASLFNGISSCIQWLSNIICADPNDPDIIYMYVTERKVVKELYAYNYREGKVVFTFSQKIDNDMNVFVHFEWPTWPCL